MIISFLSHVSISSTLIFSKITVTKLAGIPIVTLWLEMTLEYYFSVFMGYMFWNLQEWYKKEFKPLQNDFWDNSKCWCLTLSSWYLGHLLEIGWLKVVFRKTFKKNENCQPWLTFHYVTTSVSLKYSLMDYVTYIPDYLHRGIWFTLSPQTKGKWIWFSQDPEKMLPNS